VLVQQDRQAGAPGQAESGRADSRSPWFSWACLLA
jgi:hypothetical protein